MRRFKTSIAAWSAIAHGAVFLALLLILPDEAFKYAGYALVIGTGFAAIVRWYKDFFYAFREGRGGASFLIIGTFALIAIVWFHRLVVVGGATWPDLWIFESDILVRAVVWYLGWALALLFFAPDINEGAVPPKSFYTLSAGIAVGSFLMGYSFAVGTSNALAVKTPNGSDLPGCSANRPVWGSSNGVYHLPQSKYRGMVDPPSRCFKDEDEAKRKGFRPPKS